jgi:hypothetical protein
MIVLETKQRHRHFYLLLLHCILPCLLVSFENFTDLLCSTGATCAGAGAGPTATTLATPPLATKGTGLANAVPLGVLEAFTDSANLTGLVILAFLLPRLSLGGACGARSATSLANFSLYSDDACCCGL